MYNISKEMLKEVVKNAVELAKKMKGELVLLNKVSDEEDEYVISNVKDLALLKIKKGDLVELTIYVDDEDEFYEEFLIENGRDNEVVNSKIISKLNPSKKKESDNTQSNSKRATKSTKRKNKEDESKEKNRERGKKIELNKDVSSSHFQKFMKKK